ncbi:MAG: hypothetical protein HOI95_22265 [Chromatiales bacterium]|nr:hypothetical protein [Chromatiales bacterium]
MATAEHLLLDKTWFDDGRRFASWRPPARRLLHQTRCNLHRELHRSLHRSCVHLKGHGGVKGALRRIMRQQPGHRYVARFDVARYYESIDHEVLLKILRQRGASAVSEAVVADYLRLPDRHRSGCGMTAGGSLSPLLAAVMLIPLDEAMNRLWRRYGLFYVRYMDDFVLMAPTRHKLRRADGWAHDGARPGGDAGYEGGGRGLQGSLVRRAAQYGVHSPGAEAEHAGDGGGNCGGQGVFGRAGRRDWCNEALAASLRSLRG